MSFDLYTLKKNLNQQGIFFEFSGPFSQSLLAEMGDLLKKKMKMEQATSPTILKVFSLVVEQSQNIIHYSAEKQALSQLETIDLSTGLIAVGYHDDEYFVLTGNLIANVDIEHLQGKLSLIEGMTTDELKQYYKDERRKHPDSKSKGAGLGFIEIARKSSRPLEYKFIPVDEQFSFFSLNAHIH